MKLDRRKVAKNLPTKGFTVDKSKHHIYFYHTYNGKNTGPYTKVSHSKKYQDIGPNNVQAMKNQLKLDTNVQVLDLVNCPMDGQQYINVLMKKGEIQTP